MSLAQHFSAIFTLLFIFVVTFAIMQKYKFLDADKNIHALMAAVIGILFILTPITINIVSNLAPMVIILVIALVLFLFVFNVVGVTNAELAAVIKKPATSWTLGITAFLVIVAGIGFSFGQTLLDAGQGKNVTDVIITKPINSSDDYTGNVLKTVFHPKFLALVILMAIAIASVKLIAGKVIDQ
ncbi:hypothetical protein ACFL1H_03200 [Nanoarchaeota archaeon]